MAQSKLYKFVNLQYVCTKTLSVVSELFNSKTVFFFFSFTIVVGA